MTVTYTNRRGKTTYLYRGQSKSGKTSYYFSLESGGNLATAVPKGFEIYETADERAEIECGIK